MMKKILYILSCICPLLLASAHMTAQTCNANFTVSTQITNSTCQSNGEIRVTLSGSNVADLINVQYGLTSTTPGGFSIDPRTDPVLKNIPPGSYELTVRAFCKNDADFDVVKRVTGLVVGGNYTVPVATFNAASSRKPYTTCNTGKIALNVTGGNGTFTFTITSAPAGVTLGAVTPTKSGTVYTLPGESYPAGNYSIQVEDACYSAACSFTLDAISDLPTFTYEDYQGFRPDLDNTAGSCNYLKWTGSSPVLNANPDFKSYYDARLYEIGAAPAGQTPTYWTEWNNTNVGGILLNVSPNNASDFYGSNSIDIFIRVKGCPSASRSFRTNIYNPLWTYTVVTRACDDYTVRVYPYNFSYFYSVLCYPLTVNVKEGSLGPVVYDETNWQYSLNQTDQITLKYGTSYTVTITDQNGKTVTGSISNNRYFIFTTNRQECNGWQMNYAPPSGTHSCLPINIRILDSSGAEKCTDIITTSAQASSYRYSCLLDYDETYTLEATYADGQTFRSNRSQAASIPTAYNLTTYDYYDSKCVVNESRFYITSVASGGISRYWPVGTKFTIESDAVGFTTQTYTTTSSSTGYTCNLATIPAGTYKLTVDHGCGSPIVTTYNIPGIYNYRDFDYTTETTCDGLKVTPTGVVTYKGVDLPNETFYRLINGPTGYDKSTKKPGESFTFSAAGTYTLSISADPNSTNPSCSFTTKTIEYAAPPLALDANTTSAYVCVGGSVGNISIKGINGVAPYKYELWDETNTTKVAADVTTSGTAYFPYGNANTTYNVRITDGCGNNFTQGVTVADLKTARIVYSAEPEVCNGGTISLRCITLGTTTYSWTGPLGFTSTDQNPTIANAQESMEGWYKVSVTPEYCGMAVEDSIYVSVYPPLTAGASVGNQTVCVRTQTSELRSETTGGKGTYAYQWQSSADGVTWTNIPGATQATYQPPVQLQAGSLNYRKATTDDCHTVYSAPVSVVMKSCYIPVNTPNIGARP